jgi:hypothetical protein
MELRDVCEAAGYRITDGAEHLWECFGMNARMLDFESEHGSASVTFDRRDQTIYEVTINANVGFGDPEYAYRWVNPAFAAAQAQEAERRGIDNEVAYDDVRWVDLDVDEDVLEKLEAILNGDEFDTRIMMNIDMPDDLFNLAARAAHMLDITFNEFVERALKASIEEARQ